MSLSVLEADASVVMPCMPCIRTAYRNAPEDELTPLVIGCVLDKSSSSGKCQQCRSRYATGCESVRFRC